MPAILAILLLILAVIVFFWIGFNLLGLILMLVVAGLVGWLADVIVPGHLPYGWLGAILAGLLGSWLGVLLFNILGIGTGPSLFGIPIIPAIVGALILAFIVDLIISARARRTA